MEWKMPRRTIARRRLNERHRTRRMLPHGAVCHRGSRRDPHNNGTTFGACCQPPRHIFGATDTYNMAVGRSDVNPMGRRSMMQQLTRWGSPETCLPKPQADPTKIRATKSVASDNDVEMYRFVHLTMQLKVIANLAYGLRHSGI